MIGKSGTGDMELGIAEATEAAGSNGYTNTDLLSKSPCLSCLQIRKLFVSFPLTFLP